MRLNSSSDEFLVVGGEIKLVSEILMLLSMANWLAQCLYYRQEFLFLGMEFKY